MDFIVWITIDFQIMFMRKMIKGSEAECVEMGKVTAPEIQIAVGPW